MNFYCCVLKLWFCVKSLSFFFSFVVDISNQHRSTFQIIMICPQKKEKNFRYRFVCSISRWNHVTPKSIDMQFVCARRKLNICLICVYNGRQGQNCVLKYLNLEFMNFNRIYSYYSHVQSYNYYVQQLNTISRNIRNKIWTEKFVFLKSKYPTCIYCIVIIDLNLCT